MHALDRACDGAWPSSEQRAQRYQDGRGADLGGREDLCRQGGADGEDQDRCDTEHRVAAHDAQRALKRGLASTTSAKLHQRQVHWTRRKQAEQSDSDAEKHDVHAGIVPEAGPKVCLMFRRNWGISRISYGDGRTRPKDSLYFARRRQNHRYRTCQPGSAECVGDQ